MAPSVATAAGGRPAARDAGAFQASAEGDTPKLQALLEQNFDVNTSNADGITALHLAVIHNRADVARMLLEARASPSAESTGKVCTTPVSLAHLYHRTEILELLHEEGHLWSSDLADPYVEIEGSKQLSLPASPTSESTRSSSSHMVSRSESRGPRLEEESPGAASGASLRVDFGCQGGETRTVVFTQLPLGIVFDRSTPSRITHVEGGSHAGKLGVQRGWTFRYVSGQYVADKDFKTFMEFMRAGQAELSGKPRATLRVLHILCKHQDSKRAISRRTKMSTEHVTRAEAYQALRSILSRLRDLEGDQLTEAFQEEARVNSDCASYRRGGDLGDFKTGVMQATFEDATLALPVGGLSDIVDSDSGAHIILRIK